MCFKPLKKEIVHIFLARVALPIPVPQQRVRFYFGVAERCWKSSDFSFSRPFPSELPSGF